MSDTLLSVKDLTVRYRSGGDGVLAVDSVSFHLAPGETLGIVGESGSGKSTIGLSLMRLLPASAELSGKILLDGADVLSMSPGSVNKVRGATVGLVYQDALAALNPVRTVGAQIAEVLRVHLAMDRHRARRAAIEALSSVGISDAETRYGQFPHEFSGGMRQRAAIAMALAAQPRLLIADEPTTALDVTVKGQVLALLRDVKKKRNMSMIVISHDLEVIRDVADRIAVMYNGRIAEVGPKADVLAHPGHPYTRDLIGSAPSVETPIISFIPGAPPPPGTVFAGCAFEPRCSVGHGKPDCRTVVPELRGIGSHARAACHFPLPPPQNSGSARGAPSAESARPDALPTATFHQTDKGN